MKTTAVTLCGVLCALSSWAQAPAEYSADSVSVGRVSEISSGHATRGAEKGEILEVRALVRVPTVGTRLPIEQIKLVGTSKDASKTATWELAPMGIGATWKGNCAYEFPDALVKGGVGFGTGPELWLKREKEGDPAVVEFSAPVVEICAAFLVPDGAAGSTSLRIAGQRFPAKWKVPK